MGYEKCVQLSVLFMKLVDCNFFSRFDVIVRFQFKINRQFGIYKIS